jgi:N-acetylmuramoyl-L-alanine amidase
MFNTLAKTRKSLTVAIRGQRRFCALSFFPLLLSVLLLLSLTSKSVQAETMISAARIGSAPDYTRFTLESNIPVQYSLIMLDNPGRVVIDLENTVLTSTLKNLPNEIKASDPFIKAIRIGRFKPHILRLVFDLKTDVVPRAFTIDPTHEFGHRLVIDIYAADKAAHLDQHHELDKLVSSLTKIKPAPEFNANSAPIAHKIFRAAQRTKPHSARIIIVAIDAGHGGKDPGAPGPNGAHEKDITLAISKKLKAIINKEPNMRAVLTREGDYYMSLPMRRAKARRLNADLFVSVHADAAKRKSARGSSVYTLSQGGATSTMASWLAKNENSVDGNLMGGIDLVSKSSDIKEILIDLSLNATINDSTALAQHVLNEIGNINRLHKKQVERAPFAVLKSPDIPSILVETAFLSNPDDEKKLKTKSFQNKMANAMLTGIKRYLATSPALARTSIVQAE